ncbi:cold-responsive protein kinase 1-like isoform X1 [Populus nigra]|uniref:cold-responsive protein kinase 1-like isoform X1 n=3 Tax=Populus nigra TaxID=3691 RepID=UPI002B26D773|nr:cold-responsive protein kinase 1-like isoform X1 [Populus nigra]
MTCFSFFCKRKGVSRATQTTEVDDEVSWAQNTCSYTYRELRMATDNFNPANKVGEGGFGSVYKGMLKDGTMAALKVLSAESRQGLKEFLTEIKVIADIEHNNLVKLYGYCAEGNHRILVYGYLKNNSLAQTLLGGGHSNIQFNWPTRRKICIGVARGLAFLHEEVQPHIVHRDIKASNILLDDELEPKISDFGLAKLFPANLTHISTNVAGTAGYLAPEYAIRGQLTRKADIYSFGVLLLEIVCGRSNTNRRFPLEEQYLVETVWEFYQKQELVNLVDTSLAGDYDVEEACNYLKIGLLCIQDVPKQRPSMSTVVMMLMGEIEVNDKISKPGLLSDFTSFKGDKMPKHKGGKDQNNKWEMKNSSSTSGKVENSSSSSGVDTSYATMTFSSIYDRGN